MPRRRLPPERTAPASAAPEPAPAPVAAPKPAALPVYDGVSFRQVLDVPIHYVAFAPSGKVAAVGEDVWVGDGASLKKLPAPGPALADVRVYFGRDDQPRLMGAEGGAPVYRRFRGGRWQSGATEIGRLGSGKSAPLFGVLGNDDPEVVCKVGDGCIVKRRSGWQTITPPEGRPSVSLEHGTTWALAPATLLRLESEGFRAFGGTLPFSHATAISATSERDVWVAEPDALYRFDGKSWARLDAPVDGIAGVWAAAEKDVWVVGQGGAVHYDGATWSRVKEPSGALRLATGPSAADVWLAGKAGLFHAVTAADQQD